MPDNKQINPIVGIATADLSAYKKAMGEASLSAHSMTETLRLAAVNSEFQTLLDNVNRNEALARSAFGPLAELERSGLFDLLVPHQREMKAMRQAVLDYEAKFRLPEIAEATWLIKDLQFSSLSESAAKIAAETNSALQRAIESMTTPWLEIQERMRSIGAFAELQGIGKVLREMPTFDDSVAAALRVNLGDWRDQITWRPEIFTDLTARSDFYLGLGFNPDLTNFPLAAFEESLDIAGLRALEFPPFLDTGRPEAPGTDDEEEELARTNAAHDRLQRLERMLRRFIDAEMTKAFGPRWAERRLPNGLYGQWMDKKRKAGQAGAEERPLIEYADFTDYELIVCRADNWREVFAIFFSRPESVRESLQRLYPIRLDTMHGRLITQDDELFLFVEAKRLVKALKRHQ